MSHPASKPTSQISCDQLWEIKSWLNHNHFIYFLFSLAAFTPDGRTEQSWQETTQLTRPSRTVTTSAFIETGQPYIYRRKKTNNQMYLIISTKVCTLSLIRHTVLKNKMIGKGKDRKVVPHSHKGQVSLPNTRSVELGVIHIQLFFLLIQIQGAGETA